MTVLKIKAFFYRYTGIYLAHKEERNYVRSEEFWKLFEDLNSKDDISSSDAFVACIGLWQSKAGFHRPHSTLAFEIMLLRFKYPVLTSLLKLASNTCVTMVQIKWDLEKMFLKKK